MVVGTRLVGVQYNETRVEMVRLILNIYLPIIVYYYLYVKSSCWSLGSIHIGVNGIQVEVNNGRHAEITVVGASTMKLEGRWCG